MPKYIRRDPQELLPGEGSIREEAEKVFSNPILWMNRPHPMLDGRTPQQCVDEEDEQPVRDLIRRVKYVPFA